VEVRHFTDLLFVLPDRDFRSNWLHGAQSLRSLLSLIYSGISQHFVEQENSLPCSLEPSNGPYSEPDESSPYKRILFPKIYFNVILLPNSRSSSGLEILYAFLFRMRDTCPANLIFLDFLIQLIFGEG
jgi:hypothetical protein